MMIIQPVRLVIYLLLPSFLFLILLNIESVREGDRSIYWTLGPPLVLTSPPPIPRAATLASPAGGLRIGGPSLSHSHPIITTSFTFTLELGPCPAVVYLASFNNPLTTLPRLRLPCLHQSADFRTRESSRAEHILRALPIILGSPCLNRRPGRVEKPTRPPSSRRHQPKPVAPNPTRRFPLRCLVGLATTPPTTPLPTPRPFRPLRERAVSP